MTKSSHLNTPAVPDIPRRRFLKAVLAAPACCALAGGAAIYADYKSPPPSGSSDWHAFLSDEERQHPLAQYWYRTAPIADDVLSALRRGPIDPSQILRWQDRLQLSNSGYLPVENG